MRTVRAFALALLGVALSAAALWWPLQPWSLPVQVAGIVLLALGAHGLIAAADPPDPEPVREPQPADRTTREVWPAPDDAGALFTSPNLHDRNEEAA